jgi:hypothetical protein
VSYTTTPDLSTGFNALIDEQSRTSGLRSVDCGRDACRTAADDHDVGMVLNHES